MIFLLIRAFLIRFWPYFLAAALVFALTLAYNHRLASERAAGDLEGSSRIQVLFDAYVAAAELAHAKAISEGSALSARLSAEASITEGKLNAALSSLADRNRRLALDNAGLHDNLARQATAPRRTDDQNTPAACRSDEERVRIYAGLLDEGARLVEEGEQSLQRCAARLTALQRYAADIGLPQ